MNDILPEQTPVWQYVEATVRKVLGQYGYQEIRMPIVEQTDLFKRSIGEVTDIVEKEMYTFEDRALKALRVACGLPKSTACCSTKPGGCGTPARCFATSAHRKGVTASSTKWVSSALAWLGPT